MGQDASTPQKPKAEHYKPRDHHHLNPEDHHHTPQQKRVQFSHDTPNSEKHHKDVHHHDHKYAERQDNHQSVKNLYNEFYGRESEEVQAGSEPQKEDKNRDQNVIQRLLGHQEIKRVKIERLKQHLLNQEQMETTFKPKIKAGRSAPRSPQKFYEDQSEFLKKKAEKVERGRKSLADKDIMNNKSREIAERLNSSGDLYEREIQQRKKTKEKLDQARAKKQLPKSKLNHNERKEIQERLNEPKEYKEPEYNFEKEQTYPRPELIEAKITREFMKVMQGTDQSIRVINIDSMKKILVEMNYITSEKDDISDLWIFLQRDENNYAEISQALELILAIHGVQPTGFEQTYSKEQVQTVQKRTQKYYLNKLNKPREIQMDFDSSTMSSENGIAIKTHNAIYKKEAQAFAQKQLKKADSDKNVELADKFRSKYLDEYKEIKSNFSNEGLTHEDYLIFTKKQQQKKKQEQKIQKSQKELAECTFRPSINPYNSERKVGKHPVNSIGQKERCEILSKKRLSQAQFPKDFEQEEFEKQKQECTFKPNIKRSPIKKVQDSSTIPNYAESIGRTRKAWESKCEISNFLARNETHFKTPAKQNSKPPSEISQINESRQTPEKQKAVTPPQKLDYNYRIASYHTQEKFQDRLALERSPTSFSNQPLMFIDVNLGTKVERLPIYESDNLQLVALNFVRKHELKISMVPVLQEMLSQQVNMMYDRHLF